MIAGVISGGPGRYGVEGYSKLDTTTPHEPVAGIIESEKRRVLYRVQPRILTQEGPCKKFVKSTEILQVGMIIAGWTNAAR